MDHPVGRPCGSSLWVIWIIPVGFSDILVQAYLNLNLYLDLKVISLESQQCGSKYFNQFDKFKMSCSTYGCPGDTGNKANKLTSQSGNGCNTKDSVSNHACNRPDDKNPKDAATLHTRVGRFSILFQYLLILLQRL